MRTSIASVGMLCLLAALSTGCCGYHSFSTCHQGGCHFDYSPEYRTEHFDDWDDHGHRGHGADCGCDECGGGGECDSLGCGGGHLFPFHHWGCRPMNHWANSGGCLFGWGCGDAYVCDYVSDPPACCEPCDDCGHWVGPSSAKPCGSDLGCCDVGHAGCEGCGGSAHETFSHEHETYSHGMDEEIYYGASSRKPASGRKASGRTVTRATHAATPDETKQVVSLGKARRPAPNAKRQPTPASRSTINRQTTAGPQPRNNRTSGSRVASLGTKQ